MKKSSNVESFTCLWLDENVNSTEENRQTQIELRQVINHLCVYENIEPCELSIKETCHEKIILIVSGGLGREIVPRIHHLSQVFACYVYCHDKHTNKKWSQIYSKIKGIFTERHELIKAISQDDRVRCKLEEGLTISVISHEKNSLQAHNASFLWFQLFIEVLLRMYQKSSDRHELIDICEEYYQGNDKDMNIIREFAETYKSNDAVWWYTRDTCFYRMMNKALRVQDYSMLFAFRFFLTDIAKQIENQYETFIRTNSRRRIFRVYRGQAIGTDELELIRNNLNSFISMNAFLSTSRKKSVAMDFAKNIPVNDDIHAILFEIDIDPRMKTKAFADIHEISYFAEENEILITLGALFHLKSLTYDTKNSLWIVRMSLADENDYDLKEIYAFMKERVGDETNLDSLGKILQEMGQYEQAQKCYERMINEYQLGLADAKHGLGLVHYQSNKYDQSLPPIIEALHIRQQLLGDNHSKVADIHRCIGGIHWKQGNSEEALIELKKAIKILEKNCDVDPVSLARTYQTIAVVYQRLQRTELEIEYYKKALEVQKMSLPDHHPDLAVTYNNLGYFHEKTKEFHLSMDFYQKSLEISRKTLPPMHEDIRRTENNLRRLSETMKRNRLLSKK